MPSLFRRKSTELVADTVAETAVETDSRPRKGYTPKKGEATPKRPVANRRVAEPPPTNRKEALRRAREKQREKRDEERAGRLAGDDQYLLPRDKGPVRRLVRNVVDARFNAGTSFYLILLIVLVGSVVRVPIVVVAANLLFLATLLVVTVDSVLLTRRVRKFVTTRFPDTKERLGSLYFYAIMRSLSPRFMRMPKAQVKMGGEF